jgi:MFS transporter, DHA2 family, methylenomycin A resistance protein
MSTASLGVAEDHTAPSAKPGNKAGPRPTLAASLLGFFVITLDAVVVNVALPSIGREFGAGITGMQWVVDGYTLMFAALLLSAGALSDRIGARRAFAGGLIAFVAASAACGFAPSIAVLVASRFIQGAGAAVMMPASMALIGQAYPDPRQRSGAVAAWAMGGSVASTSGPIVGGLLTLVSWRWIFFINLPVGLLTLAFLWRTPSSPRRRMPFDFAGQATAVTAMAALTFGAIEAGAKGVGSSLVLASAATTVAALIAFAFSQARGAHPMVPATLFRSRNATIAMAVGFAFMVGYFGLPFVVSLYLQEHRGLSSLATGAAFLPMMLTGLALTPFSARLARWAGSRRLIVTGLIAMAAGLSAIALLPSSTPVWALALWMMLVGVAGPFIAPPIAAVLLDSVLTPLAGTASGVFNTSRQVGGALAVAVFGALLTQSASFMHGLRLSLLLAAGVSLMAAAAGLRLDRAKDADAGLQPLA